MDTYGFYLFVRDLPELTAATLSEVTKMRGLGNNIGADRLLRAFAALRDGLIAMEAAVAIEGTKILREKERTSRVRPDTLGDGGPRLGDYLHCDPLGVALAGSVGIANYTELDDGVPWWSTNEVGSSARVGHVLYGVFQPGEAAPDAGEFREHPIFEPRPSGTERGSGVIRNPIPARRFVEHAIPEVEALWRAEFAVLQQTFIAELTAAQLGLLGVP